MAASRFGLAALTLWAMLTGIGALALQMSFEDNVLTVPQQRDLRGSIVALIPERWAFFTKSPRSEGMQAYAPSADASEWTQATTFPIFQLSNAFGLDRTVRAGGIEIGALDMAGNQAPWFECASGETRDACLRAAADAEGFNEVQNPSPAPLLCGRIALLGITPSPWAYAAIGQDQPTYRVKTLEVSC